MFGKIDSRCVILFNTEEVIRQRTQFLIGINGFSLNIISQSSFHYFLDFVEGYLSVDDLMSRGESDDTSVTPIDVEKDILVLPYSSGTTGLPKGVMVIKF